MIPNELVGFVRVIIYNINVLVFLVLYATNEGVW
jgi:hypothetical protein